MRFERGQVFQISAFDELRALLEAAAVEDARGDLQRAVRDAVGGGRIRQEFERAVDHLFGVQRLADLQHGGFRQDAQAAANSTGGKLLRFPRGMVSPPRASQWRRARFRRCSRRSNRATPCAGSAAEVRLANGRTAAVSANTGAVTKINRYIASRIERIKIQFSVLAQPALLFSSERNSRFCYLCIGSMEINPGQILSIALASLPTMLTVLVGILINNSRLGDVNSRIGDINARIDDLRSNVDSRIDDLRSHIDSRFDEMRSTWTSELRRVEEVLDARLKHLEER